MRYRIPILPLTLITSDVLTWPNSGRVYRLMWRQGAGYKRGWTAYLAINAQRRKWEPYELRGKRYSLQVGITRNWNIIPLA